ncbi:hypothetical protein [Roseibium algae]|uniref:Uncharacterized protein n=1 Tax=Roseibium algae TaxID=3123038 RepID=A0ABU8TRF1_9HYPH
MKRALGTGLLALTLSFAPAGLVHAGKGDRVVRVHSSAPLLERKVLDLRFADFAQGIWAMDTLSCDNLKTIDRSKSGSVLAVFRGLLETPDRICMVYGAEQRATKAQRAAIDCHLVSGGESLDLVTVRTHGSDGLELQAGEHPPKYFRFCQPIDPVTQSLIQSRF